MKVMTKDIVGHNAISMQSGTNLYDIISTNILSGKAVELDFEGVNLFASPFFNASIGLLLKDIELPELQSNLKIENLSPVGKHLLNHVIKNAIEYYDESTNIASNLKEIPKDPEAN